MKLNLSCAISVLLFVSLAFADTADDTLGAASDKTKVLSRDQLFQDFSGNLTLDGPSDSGTRNIDETTMSTELGLPPDLWNNKILPSLSCEDAGNFMVSNKELKIITRSRLQDYSTVAKACGIEVANVLIKQQWSVNYQEDAVLFEILNQTEANRVHNCLWETKKWVETLDEPQSVKVQLNLYDANLSVNLLLLDKNLFEVNGKAHFNLKIASKSNVVIENVFQAISENQCLKSLDLSGYLIDQHQTIKLARILKNNTSLQHLILSWNHIMSSGAKALAEALESNTGLLTLNLESTYLDDEEAIIALFKALEKNTKLLSLNLNLNGVGNSRRELKALQRALKINKDLKELCMMSNRISSDDDDDGQKVIADIIENSNNNNALEVLDLRFNDMKEEAREELKSLAEKIATKSGRPFILKI